MIPIKFIISSLVTVNCKLFLSRSAHLLVCSTSNSAMSLKNISNLSHSVYLMRMHVQEFSRNFLTRYIFNNNLFFLVRSSKFYPASPMDKLLSAVYLISSEWDMLKCVQFPTVVGFVDIQSCVWENTMREQNKNKNKWKIYLHINKIK